MSWMNDNPVVQINRCKSQFDVDEKKCLRDRSQTLVRGDLVQKRALKIVDPRKGTVEKKSWIFKWKWGYMIFYGVVPQFSWQKGNRYHKGFFAVWRCFFFFFFFFFSFFFVFPFFYFFFLFFSFLFFSFLFFSFLFFSFLFFSFLFFSFLFFSFLFLSFLFFLNGPLHPGVRGWLADYAYLWQ